MGGSDALPLPALLLLPALLCQPHHSGECLKEPFLPVFEGFSDLFPHLRAAKELDQPPGQSIVDGVGHPRSVDLFADLWFQTVKMAECVERALNLFIAKVAVPYKFGDLDP